MTDSGHGVADLAGQIRGMRSRIYQDRHGPDLSGGGRSPSGVMWVFWIGYAEWCGCCLPLAGSGAVFGCSLVAPPLKKLYFESRSSDNRSNPAQKRSEAEDRSRFRSANVLRVLRAAHAVATGLNREGLRRYANTKAACTQTDHG